LQTYSLSQSCAENPQGRSKAVLEEPVILLYEKTISTNRDRDALT
jgi:hypothetical protein